MNFGGVPPAQNAVIFADLTTLLAALAGIADFFEIGGVHKLSEVERNKDLTGNTPGVGSTLP